MYNKEQFEAYRKTKHLADLHEKALIDRIDEVISVIAKVFDKPRTQFCWYFSDAGEGKTGTPEVDEDAVQYCLQSYAKTYSHLQMNTNMWSYSEGFPTKFLFMPDQEIVNLLKMEIKQTREKNDEIKLKKKTQDRVLKEKKKQVLKKLTPSEKKLLGL